MNVFGDIFPNVLLATRDAAVLALFIGGVLFFCGGRIAPGWRHGLWLLVAVRLLLPVLPDSAFSWRGWWGGQREATVLSGDPSNFPKGAESVGGFEFTDNMMDRTVTALGAGRLEETAEHRWTLMEFLSWVWISGVVLHLAGMLVGVIRLQRRIGRCVSRDRERRGKLQSELDALCAENGIARVPELVLTEAVDAPALTGWLRPRILLPMAAVDGLSDRQIRLVLLHELGHQRRHDVAINWMLCLLLAVHWFNPLVWWAFRRSRIEAERATDEWVLHRDRAGRPADYGETLIRLLESVSGKERRFPGVVGVLESRRSLRSRIESISRFRGKRSRWVGAFSILLLLGLGAIGLTQPPKEEGAITTKPLVERTEPDVPSAPDDGRSQIQFEAKIWRMVEGGAEELIDTPETVTLPGEWTVFENRSQIHFPTAYDIPRLPEALAARATGGGTLDHPGEAAARWGTHTADVVIPPTPQEFGKESVGWTLKARPEWDEAGQVRIACVLEQRALRGFTNRGIAITAETDGGMFGTTKSRIVTENRQLHPVFLERRQELVFETGEGGLVSKMVSDTGEPKPEGEGIVAGFAEGLCESVLPRLRIEMKGRAVSKESGDGGKAVTQDGDQSQIYVSAKFVETTEELRGWAGPMDSIFSDPQFQVMIRALSQRKGVDLMVAPSLTLRDGESGQIEVLREFVYPTKYDPPSLTTRSTESADADAKAFPVTPATPTAFETFDTGVRLGVVARQLKGGIIELELTPQVSESRALLNFGVPLHAATERESFGILLSENRIEQPVFEERSHRTKVRVLNGQTVLVGGLISETKVQIEDRVPLIGLVTESKTEIERRFLYLFVTPQLIRPR